MTKPTKSYREVAYDLRPAKQVERRMILDALGRLMNQGVPIRDYQYTGFGSIYFFDFLLLYKLVGLQRFLTVEYDTDITKRVAFNKPFERIEIRMEPVGDVIPTLSRDLRHILWLDYDDRLTSSMLRDTAAASYHLPGGSLLLVTVDAEPPAGRSTPAEYMKYFESVAGDFLPYDFDIGWCKHSRLPETNLSMLGNAMKSGLAARELEFLPLFKFVYADGHEMVTLGGMIGGETERRTLASCAWGGASYLRRDLGEAPFRIRVPLLTRRERLFLDHHMPCSDEWRPQVFELPEDDIQAYREIHRFYPHYGELLA